MNWDTNFAARTAHMRRSTIREILKLTSLPDVISFAGGLPAPEYFPVQRVQEATDLILAERGQEVLQYSTTEGMVELRDFIAKRLSTPNLQLTRDNVVIVTGSQQGLDLIGRIMLNEGDTVIVENPTYLGMLLSWKPLGVNFVPVVTDMEGMRVQDLEPLLQKYQPKLVYSVPTFQNPRGVTLTESRRAELVRLVNHYNVPLVEDCAYSELRYSGDPVTALLEMDAIHLHTNHMEGSVIYLGTFSKILTPGLRIGWIAAPFPVIDKVVQAKQSADLHTSTLTQFIAHEVSKDGFLETHIQKLREVYTERRDVMVAAMETYFPEEVHFTRPDGGLFLMAEFPEYVDAAELLKLAVENKVAFIPGEDFFVGGIGRNTCRLNFSNQKPERIEEGIRRMGELLKDEVIAHQFATK
ncbi:MAG: PLP-dependent aminotransferase family protein [Anaerolineae bacterium]|nr:PLP-dependent aminotransferase family protein [Anaerolineae bacterium]